MSVGNSRRIPHFLAAASLRELQRRMFFNNVKDGMEYKYFDIQFDVVGNKWVAFFNREIPSSDVTPVLTNVEVPSDGG